MSITCCVQFTAYCLLATVLPQCRVPSPQPRRLKLGLRVGTLPEAGAPGNPERPEGRWRYQRWPWLHYRHQGLSSGDAGRDRASSEILPQEGPSRETHGRFGNAASLRGSDRPSGHLVLHSNSLPEPMLVGFLEYVPAQDAIVPGGAAPRRIACSWKKHAERSRGERAGVGSCALRLYASPASPCCRPLAGLSPRCVTGPAITTPLTSGAQALHGFSNSSLVPTVLA